MYVYVTLSHLTKQRIYIRSYIMYRMHVVKAKKQPEKQQYQCTYKRSGQSTLLKANV